MSCIEAPSVERRIEEEGEEMMEDDEEEEEEELEDEDDEVEEEEEEEEGEHCEVTVGRRSGRGLTLKTLLKERVLEPGEGSMTINYLGNKFKGDLLPDGRIRSQETNKIFGTPSAWAIYCKKIVNPDKKSGCGWASVRYRGKKLDSYKNNWFRQKRLEYEKEEEEMEEEESGCESEEASPHEQEILEFDLLGHRSPNHDPATMIELGTFQSVGRMQPFNVTMSSSAMAVIDVHAHLTTSEVVGYLAGQWDVNNHNLIVSHAFPVRCRLGDADKGAIVEQELYAEMARLKLSLVGWYHTHPHAPPLPTLRDVDSQLDYEMKMKGYNDASYTPVLGIIVSPYQKSPLHERGIPHPNGNAIGFWVMPPPENKPLEYGRPMSMQFTVVQDAFIPKEALHHMRFLPRYPVNNEPRKNLDNLPMSFRGLIGQGPLIFPPLMEFLMTKVIDKKLADDDPSPLPPTKYCTILKSEVIKFYKDVPDVVEMTDIFEDKFTYWHKLKGSLKGRVPKDHFNPLIEFLTKVIDKKLPEDDPAPLPPPNPPVSSVSSSLSSVTTATSSIMQPPATANLPLSTSLSLVDTCKEAVPSAFLDSFPSTKDLESCVSNILKSSMGADLIPISSTLMSAPSSGAESILLKERDHSVTITPSLSCNTNSQLTEKHEEQHLPPTSSSSRPKSAEGRTPPPPPKSYSPLFQLPLPPLFSLDSNKPTKDTHHLKGSGSCQPINLQMDEKRHSEFLAARAKSRSPSSKVEKPSLPSSDEPIALDSSSSSGGVSSNFKYDVSELASKLKRREPMETVTSTGGYLDLSILGSKDPADSAKSKKFPRPEEHPAKKELSDLKLGAADVASWFAQAKLMQETFSLPPHERENPFVRAASPATHRDVPPLFSSEFLSSQWSPLLKAGYHPSLAFPGDSKPTYHSDVPLLLKKQQQEELVSKDPLHEAREIGKKILEEQQHHLHHREFRLPPEYKDTKENRAEHKKSREMRERPRDVRSSPFEDREFKEPRMIREHLGSDHPEVLRDSREDKEMKITHTIRDLQDPARRDFWEVKDPLAFDDVDSENRRDLREGGKESKESRDYREMKDQREMSLDIKEVRDTRDPRSNRDPRDLRDPRDHSKDFREMVRDRRELIEPREALEMRDPWADMRDHRSEASVLHVREDLRDFRKNFDHAEGKASKASSDHREAAQSPVNLSDLGLSKDSVAFRNVNPMDMSTFKIKRDLMHPEGRHFIEPTGIRRHHPESEATRGLAEYPDSSRELPKENVINFSTNPSKDHFDGKGLHQPQEPRLEGANARGLGYPLPSLMREPSHDARDSIPKALINLIDPKNLLDPRDYREITERLQEAPKSERDDRESYPPRRLFPDDDSAAQGGVKENPSVTPPVYISHRPTGTSEVMDYD